MTKIIMTSTVAALLLLSGCSKNSPSVDETAQKPTQEKKQEVQEPEAVETEVVPENEVTVSGSESSENATDENQNSMQDEEAKFQTVNFAFDKFNIMDSQEDKVNSDVTLAKETSAKYSIKLEGNCDEWGSDEYNYALGLRRANTIKKAMTNSGVDASRIVMVSYGESNPVCSDKTQECWAKNRRVDFKLLP